jgi:hypothetical protein
MVSADIQLSLFHEAVSESTFAMKKNEFS